MNIKRLGALVILLISMQCGFSARAQDVHFSQFYMAPLIQNPALAGSEHNIEAILNYKNQWQSISIPFQTYAFSYDMRVFRQKNKKGFWSAGINFFSDKDGNAAVATTEGALTIAYHVAVSQYSILGAGIQGAYAQRSISYSSLQWGDQFGPAGYDPSLSSGEPVGSNSIAYPDLGAGINWAYDNTEGSTDVTDNHDKKADVGFAVFHINQPGYSFYKDGEKLDMKYVFHGSGLFGIANSNIGFAPGFLYYKEGSAQEIYVGTLVRYKLKQSSKYTGANKSASISLGGYYRAGDAGVAAMLLQYDNYALGVSYDVNVSGLTSASSGRGGIEIALRFITPNPSSPHGSHAMF